MVTTYRVKGDARVVEGTGLTTQPYEREFTINDVSGDGIARSIIKKTMLPDNLRETMPGYKSVRRMDIENVVQKKGKKPKEEVTDVEVLMEEALKLGAVPDGLSQYGSSEAKCEALRRSIEKKRGGRKSRGSEQDLGYVE